MDNDGMEMRFGKGTVRENLERAVADGRLTAHPDGTVGLPPPTAGSAYLHVKPLRHRNCTFLSEFLFSCAYDGAAVPHGCRDCYKIKIVPKDFRALIALRTLLEGEPYPSKCGVDFYNENSRENYAGYLYLDGLDGARAAYRQMRSVIDRAPDLGVGTVMTIKRGCSHFEAAVGPSDQWTFRDGMAELEETSKARYLPQPRRSRDYAQRKMTSLFEWLQFAFSIKDDTYLDFTGGKPLRKPSVSYPVD